MEGVEYKIYEYSKNRWKIGVNREPKGSRRVGSEVVVGIGDSREKLGECPVANYRIPFVQNYASDARYSTEYDRKSRRGNRVLA